jgi:hypothetical protein
MENALLIVSPCAIFLPHRIEEEVFEIKFMIIGLHRCITAAVAAASAAAGKNGFIA